MNSTPRSKRTQSNALASRYEAALRRYLKHGPAANLQTALKLGRLAVAIGLETLDMALIHEQALLALVLPVEVSAARERILKRAGVFFVEAITPIEEGHRGALEANLHLSRMNQALNVRTLDLAASNRQLKKEIARRQVVEENLWQSEQHSVRLLEESRQLQESLRLLSRRILSVQEEERKRISRELHDVIAQMLTGINIRLATLKTDAATSTKNLGNKISRTQRLVEKSVDRVHQFARELRPAVLDDLGLIPALHSYLKRFTKETGIRSSLTVFEGLEALSITKRTVLYRTAQEALTNVERHAQASRVEVGIRRLPKAVHMRVKDDGKSFDVEQVWQGRQSQHLGLLGMRERVEMVGGTFMIESAPGKGTAVDVQLPFNNVTKKEHLSP